MQRKRVVIHAGYHKTGTTSIQVAMTRARQRLRAYGVLYPQSGVPDEFPYGHHLLPWSLMKQPPAGRSLAAAARDELWRELGDEITASPAAVVILSSEEFDRLDRAEISSVAERLQDHDIIPVIFLRNHADLIETMFRTHVIHLGYAASIQRFAAEEAPRLDFANMARDWMTVARSGAGIIMSYEDGSIRRDSVAAFRSAIELDADCLGGDQPVFVNTSAPAFVCEMVRHLRDQHGDEADVRQWIDEVLRVDFGTSVGTDYGCMPRELSAVLHRRFEAETTAIASAR